MQQIIDVNVYKAAEANAANKVTQIKINLQRRNNKKIFKIF